jgi:hypothetical protein
MCKSNLNKIQYINYGAYTICCISDAFADYPEIFFERISCRRGQGALNHISAVHLKRCYQQKNCGHGKGVGNQ